MCLLKMFLAGKKKTNAARNWLALLHLESPLLPPLRSYRPITIMACLPFWWDCSRWRRQASTVPEIAGPLAIQKDPGFSPSCMNC